jgi:hypothetical protein
MEVLKVDVGFEFGRLLGAPIKLAPIAMKGTRLLSDKLKSYLK